MSNRKMWTKIRKHKKKKRKDPLYHSFWMHKFLNKMTKHSLNWRIEKIVLNLSLTLKNYILPFPFFIFILKKNKWTITSQLRRLGKYHHSIPTFSSISHSCKHGMVRLRLALFKNHYRPNPSFITSFRHEIWNLKFNCKDSIVLSEKKLHLGLVLQNKAFTHFRWK